MSSTPVLFTDEDIESVPSCNPDGLQNSSDSLWDMHGGERRPIYYVRRSKSKKTLKDIVQAMAELVTLAEELEF